MNNVITIKADTIGSAWIECMRRIYEHGTDSYDGNVCIREIMGLLTEISNPQLSDDIIERFGDKEMVKWMDKNFFSMEPVFDEKLSYGQRLFNHQGTDQINWLIKKLQNKRETKQATITLLAAPQDVNEHIPCVCVLDFKIRDNKLNLYCFCRSQDIAKKMYADNIALLKIMKMLARELGLETGIIASFISSAHVYEKDYNWIKSMLENKNENEKI